jgi:CHAT domain-containing protein/Flp pilus assembly protein TadD
VRQGAKIAGKNPKKRNNAGMSRRLPAAVGLFLVFLQLSGGCAAIRPRSLDEQLAWHRETGSKAYERSDYRKARSHWKAGLDLARQHYSRAATARFLIALAQLSESTGDYQGALDHAQKGLKLSESLDNAILQGKALNIIGLTHRRMGRYVQAQTSSQAALEIAEKLGELSLASASLRNLGAVYQARGDYEIALTHYWEALALAQNGKEPAQEAKVLNNIAGIHRRRGAYRRALDDYHHSLALRERLKDQRGQGMVLGDICLVHQDLNDTERALDYCQRALNIARRIGDRAREANNLNNIGGIYRQRGDFRRARKYYKQSTTLKHAMSDRSGEARSLNNIGELYLAEGDLERARSYLARSLRIKEALGDRSGESATHYNLGLIHSQRRDYDEALIHFQRAWALQLGLSEPNLLWRIYDDLGRIYDVLGNPGIAIFFGKLAVNTLQSVRVQIRDLDKTMQRYYLADKIGVYKYLSRLLLDRGRVLEAQRVLDLLKVQELQNYLQDVRGNREGLPWHPQERRIGESYEDLRDQAVQLGRKESLLREIAPAERTGAQKQRLGELQEARYRLVDKFNAFIESPDVNAIFGQLGNSVRSWSPDLERLIGLRKELWRLDQNAVLLYPLILEDRLELVLATPYTSPVHRAVAINRKDFFRAIGGFRDALRRPSADVKYFASRFYDWLIKPIESDLAAAAAQTILYAPDGPLRYIPLAATYDGNRWLIERFRVNNITAFSLTNLNTLPQPELEILAGAFTTGSYRIEIGQETKTFSGLRYAAEEVKALRRLIPNTTPPLLDGEFSREAMLPIMDDYTVVHLATHAAFLVGQPEDSFILFGNGDRVTLQDVKRWQFERVDLMVLSACDTALGGDLGNGEEILGFGFLMERAGTRAALASLWQVSDGGTQALMTAFYSALQGGAGKAEALQRAQQALATGDYTALENKDRGVAIVFDEWIHDKVPSDVYPHLSHPYYWAPFILIGNGL